MIRIRPGHSWRLNPGYVDELRALSAPRAKAFDGGGILDVLGIEVDGVDIAAGVGEAEVLVAVDELLAALRHLAQGSAAAQATVGRGPTELVLESRGNDVLLSLVTLAPPARVLASGLLLDSTRLWSAAAAAARSLAADLLHITPTLAESPLLRRLRRAARQPRREPATPWPRSEGRSFVARAGRGIVRCEVQVPAETAARLADRGDVPDAPLAALLGSGAVALRCTGAPALQWEAPVYLVLRNLVRDAAALLQAWEAGEPAFRLHFGSAEVSCDLTRDEVRAPGWRVPARVPPALLCLALAGAARAYAEKAQRIAGRAPAVEDPLRDLRASAARLARQCAELLSGDLRRARELVAAPPPVQPPRAPPPPLSRGRIRRLVYREAWKAKADERPAAIWPCAGAIVTAGAHRVVGRDAASGKLVFEEPCRFAARAIDGDDVFVSGADFVARLDSATGEARWRRRIPAAGELWAVPGGVVRAWSSGLERLSEAGTQTWRTRLPGGPAEQVLHAEGVLLCAARGVLAAIDAAEGRLLWKRRARVLALAAAPGKVVALCAAARPANLLLAFDPHSGRVAWERPLVDGSDAALCLWSDAALILSGDRRRVLTAARLADGTRRFSTPLPFTGHVVLSADEHVLVAAGHGGAAARIDERGRVAWHLEAEGDAPAEAALLLRGIALLRRRGALLCDAAAGHELAQLASETPRLAALADDMTIALVDEDDELSVHRLATHLSIV